MCMRTIKCLGALLLGALSAVPVMAQQTYEEMEQLTWHSRPMKRWNNSRSTNR